MPMPKTQTPPYPAVQYVSAATRTASLNAPWPDLGTTSTTLSRNASTNVSGPKTAANSALLGREWKAAPTLGTMDDTYAQVVEPPLMEPSAALAHRKLKPLTPYIAEAWSQALQAAGAATRFATVITGLRYGFNMNFPLITQTQSPPNRDSIVIYQKEFNEIIQKEITKKRYIGPFLPATLELIIGPFQTSPLSLVPKAGKPGKFRLIQNFSFPHSNNTAYPHPSINSYINSDDFPTTWGKFSIIYLIISQLPPGSEAATRDVAEAYRTIPLHPSQWPAAVVRISDSQVCIDSCAAFGAAPSAGVYGHLADAGAEITRHRGLGPLDKWVDDHIYFRIRKEFLETYNQMRSSTNLNLAKLGMQQTGSRLWFGNPIEELNEDCTWPIKDFSNLSPQSPHDSLFTYCLEDLDMLALELGIKLELSKDQPFRPSTTYIGFIWCIGPGERKVSLSPSKVDKYLLSIHEWRKRAAHTLNDVQKLHGKLTHACSAAPHGRAYLTSLEKMLGICSKQPFATHRPIKGIAEDLLWWSELLQTGQVSRPIYPPTSFSDPQAFSDASSGIGIGIIIGKHWRAWRLIPGWQTAHGQRDIGWAEAIGFELLIHALSTRPELGRLLITHGDNRGVVEGWWKGRHRNAETNEVFKRINTFTHGLSGRFEIQSSFIASAFNPADPLSRGIYPPTEFLLPPILLPEPIREFLIDGTAALTNTERRLFREGR